MTDDVIHIVLICDDKYAQHTAVTIVSVVKNTKRKVHFYVFDFGILPENLERLKRLDVGSNVVEVVRVQKVGAFDRFRQSYFPDAMYRLMVPEILPNLDKALCLDSDVVVVRDIGLVYDIDLGDKLLAGNDALEFYEDQIADMECGFHCGKIYFHCGFLLMNLKKMREWSFCEKLIEITKSVPLFTYLDQGVLYFLLDDCHWKVLSRSCFLFLMFSSDTIYPSVCYHYSGKPWLVPEFLMCFLPGMFWNIMHKYYKYLSYTPWKDCKNKYINLRITAVFFVKWLLHRNRFLFRDKLMDPFKPIIEEIKKA